MSLSLNEAEKLYISENPPDNYTVPFSWKILFQDDGVISQNTNRGIAFDK
jgi:hypothetical protein